MTWPADKVERLRRSLSNIAARTHRDSRRLADGTVDGFGITLQVDGQEVFGGCNDFTRAVDELQYAGGDGPCLQAQHTGVRVESLTVGTGELRWPSFTPRAAELGLRSVASTPFEIAHLRRSMKGSLNVYGTTSDQLAELQPADVVALIDAVERALTVPGLPGPRDDAAVRPEGAALHDPVGSRTAGIGETDLHRLVATLPVIEQAKGVLMGYYGINADQAFTVLRRWSSERHTKLRDVSAALLDRVVANPRPDLSGGLRALLDTDSSARPED